MSILLLGAGGGLGDGATVQPGRHYFPNVAWELSRVETEAPVSRRCSPSDNGVRQCLCRCWLYRLSSKLFDQPFQTVLPRHPLVIVLSLHWSGCVVTEPLCDIGIEILIDEFHNELSPIFRTLLNFSSPVSETSELFPKVGQGTFFPTCAFPLLITDEVLFRERLPDAHTGSLLLRQLGHPDQLWHMLIRTSPL